MHVARAVLCICAGCGRLAFDDVPTATGADAPAMADAPPSPAQIVAALPCETDVQLRAIPRTDSIQWIATADTLALAAILHLDNTHHEIHFYTLALGSSGVANPTDMRTYATSDMYGLSVEPAGTGYVMAFTDLSDTQLHLFSLDASFAPQSNTTLTGMTYTAKPLARSAAGVRVIGITANGVGMQVLDASNQPVGAPIDVETGSAGEPTIAAMGADFVVGWTQLGACAFERVSAAGTVLAGPVTATPPASSVCGLPFATVVGSAVVVAMVDRTDSVNPVAYAAAIDPAFSAATTPTAIGAADSTADTATADTTRAVVSVRTTGDSRVVAVTPTGTASPLGADFGLNGTDVDAQAIASVETAILHARTESGMLEIRKLCR